jgi:[ribosomal protein S18]-alanine N-acetyltransferase
VSTHDRLTAVVRKATGSDVDGVAALESAVFGGDAWSRDSVLQELTSPLRQVYVAVDARGDVRGYVVVLGLGDVADLQRIAVAETHRRRGVAAALLGACDLSAYGRVVLEVRADNEAALAFYCRHGFTEVSRRRGYYADGADAVEMQRPVTDEAGR